MLFPHFYGNRTMNPEPPAGSARKILPAHGFSHTGTSSGLVSGYIQEDFSERYQYPHFPGNFRNIFRVSDTSALQPASFHGLWNRPFVHTACFFNHHAFTGNYNSQLLTPAVTLLYNKRTSRLYEGSYRYCPPEIPRRGV